MNILAAFFGLTSLLFFAFFALLVYLAEIHLQDALDEIRLQGAPEIP